MQYDALADVYNRYIKGDVQNCMSLYSCMRYKYKKEKTDLMMSIIPNLCTEVDKSEYFQSQVRYYDHDTLAAFKRDVSKMRLAQHIDAVIPLIRSAHTNFFNSDFDTQNTLPELQTIGSIISLLYTICDRLDDGQEWLVRHEVGGHWTLYSMNAENTFRTEKNPVAGETLETHNAISPPPLVV